ncbi:MAG: YbaK/EbsC family protein, partial [Mycetocola sp.]
MTEQGSAGGRDRMQADADARGLAVEVVPRPAASSLEEAAGLLGIEPREIVKTLVVKRHDGDFLFALVPGGRKISWSKLRGLVGVNKL